jgi:hypothetical protein
MPADSDPRTEIYRLSFAGRGVMRRFWAAPQLHTVVNLFFRITLVITLAAALVVGKHAFAVAQGVPDLSRLDNATRQSIELACIMEQSNGPAAYGGCLRAQLRSIGIQPAYAHTQREHVGAPSFWHDPGIWALVIVAFFYLTPVLWVLLSSRSRGVTKFGWFLVIVFFSWLGCGFQRS